MSEGLEETPRACQGSRVPVMSQEGNGSMDAQTSFKASPSRGFRGLSGIFRHGRGIKRRCQGDFEKLLNPRRPARWSALKSSREGSPLGASGLPRAFPAR